MLRPDELEQARNAYMQRAYAYLNSYKLINSPNADIKKIPLQQALSACRQAQSLGHNSFQLIALSLTLSKEFETQGDITSRNECLSLVRQIAEKQEDINLRATIFLLTLNCAKEDCQLLQTSIEEGISLFHHGIMSEKLTQDKTKKLFNVIMSSALENGLYSPALNCLRIALETKALSVEDLNYPLGDLNKLCKNDSPPSDEYSKLIDLYNQLNAKEELAKKNSSRLFAFFSFPKASTPTNADANEKDAALILSCSGFRRN